MTTFTVKAQRHEANFETFEAAVAHIQSGMGMGSRVEGHWVKEERAGYWSAFVTVNGRGLSASIKEVQAEAPAATAPVTEIKLVTEKQQALLERLGNGRVAPWTSRLHASIIIDDALAAR